MRHLLLLAASVVVALASPVNAQVDTPAAFDMTNAVVAGGRIVSGPGVTSPRDMGREWADAFLRSWFGYSLFGQPTLEAPPDGTSPYRLEILFEDPAHHTQVMLVDYATEGDSAWVSIVEQDLGWGRATGAWIKAPADTKRVFDGTRTAAPPGLTAGPPWGRVLFLTGLGLAALGLGFAGAVLLRRRKDDAGPSRTTGAPQGASAR